MARISPSAPVPDPVEVDPFRYGWRYQRRTLPDGREVLEQVPLTLAEVLHPDVGDFIVNSSAHNEDRNYLADVFQARLAGNPTAVVLQDTRVAWDVPDIRPLAPDVAVILGVKNRGQRTWRTFDVAAEGVRPLLNLEITSADSDVRKNDLEIKVDYYYRAGVAWYVIVDAVERPEGRTVEVIGYRHGPRGYVRFAPDAQGRLWLKPVGVWLGVRGGRVVCYDGNSNEVIGDYVSLTQARAAAESRAVAAETRLRELEARLRRRQ